MSFRQKSGFQHQVQDLSLWRSDCGGKEQREKWEKDKGKLSSPDHTHHPTTDDVAEVVAPVGDTVGTTAVLWTEDPRTATQHGFTILFALIIIIIII